MQSETRSIIESVTTPLGFFVLIVLLVEVIFGFSAFHFSEQRSIIVVAMICLIFTLITIVAFLSYSKPEALRGRRFKEDPEIVKMREKFRTVEHLVDRLVGVWEFVTQYEPEGQPQAIEVRGFCNIIKGQFGISMHGAVVNEDGKPSVTFDVKQAFVSEESLTYIYNVPQGIGQSLLGVGEVMFVNDKGGSSVDKMRGNWAVLGSKISGEVEFNRKD